MSDRDDVLARIARPARARAEEAARLEARLRARGSHASVDGVMDALAAAEPPRAARPARARWIGGAAIGAFAVAAGLALVMRAPDEPAFAIAPYAVAVTGRAEATRAESDAVATSLEARAGAVEQVVLRPRDAARPPRAVRVLARDASGATSPLPIAPDVSDLGTVRFDVRGDDLAAVTELLVELTPASGPAAVVARIPVELPSGTNVAPRR